MVPAIRTSPHYPTLVIHWHNNTPYSSMGDGSWLYFHFPISPNHCSNTVRRRWWNGSRNFNPPELIANLWWWFMPLKIGGHRARISRVGVNMVARQELSPRNGVISHPCGQSWQGTGEESRTSAGQLPGPWPQWLHYWITQWTVINH